VNATIHALRFVRWRDASTSGHASRICCSVTGPTGFRARRGRRMPRGGCAGGAGAATGASDAGAADAAAAGADRLLPPPDPELPPSGHLARSRRAPAGSAGTGAAEAAQPARRESTAGGLVDPPAAR
jgi:hypothetical protein